MYPGMNSNTETTMKTTTLYFTKRFTSGLLKGQTHTDSMPFTSPERGVLWMKRCRENKRLNWEFVDWSFQNFTR